MLRDDESEKPKLTHLDASGSAHMVSISSKAPTKRSATAVCTVVFSNHTSIPLILQNKNKKGDVLGVARIAGIMAAKQTSSLIPLCHPIAITHVAVDVEVSREQSAQDPKVAQSVPWAGTGQGDSYQWKETWKPSSGVENSSMRSKSSENFGRIDISATVSCDGKTGVEMEALMAASTAALTVYDMCKAVDKQMRVEGLRVTRKVGGKSGDWVEGEKIA